MRKVFFSTLVAALLCAGFAAPARAQEFDYSAFDWNAAGSIVAQSGGRIKPLDTFARELVAMVHGQSHYRAQHPVETYFRWMADGEAYAREPLIYLPKSDLRTRMGLDEREGKWFSLDELQRNQALFQVALEGQAREEAGEKLTFTQSKASELFNRMHVLSAVFTHGHPLLVPSHGHDPMATWHSMPDALNSLDSAAVAHLEAAESISDTLQILALAFTGMYHAVNDVRGDIFNTAARVFAQTQADMLREQPQTLSRLDWEITYNRWRPFFWAQVFLLTGFAFYLVSLRRGWGGLKAGGLTGLVLGLVSYTAGLAIRAFLAGRAPWSNMYESLLAIGWAMLLIAIVWMLFRHDRTIGMVSSLLGVFILGIAQFASLDRGINPLVPALQSYWLNYHVIIVLASYGCFALAMGLGHAVLINAVRTKGEVTPGLLSLTKTNLKVIQVGSLLLIAGILLGAVWANVSWGRFWGWDPKETWALICWFVYIILLHGRSAGWIGWRGLAAWSVGAFPIVIMTYYGVNYYLSGLHSYGAGSSPGIPWQVFAYLAFEAAFLFWALNRLRGVLPPRPRKPKSAPAASVQATEVS